MFIHYEKHESLNALVSQSEQGRIVSDNVTESEWQAAVPVKEADNQKESI